MVALPSLKPLTARIARKLRPRTLADVAAERRELSPATTSDRPPAIALPGEFDRAQHYFMAREFEWARIAGGLRAEGPTVAYALDGALMAGGTIYAGGAMDPYRPDAARLMLRGPVERRAQAVLATSHCAEIYFGDWMVEHFSLALAAERMGLPGVTFPGRPWLHEPGYRALLGVPRQAVAATRFDRLWLIDDRGLNAFRGERLRELRRRVAASVPTVAPSSRIFLARGTLGTAREVTNPAELEAFLLAHGFLIVSPEQEEPAALAAKLASARLALCVEGSAQMHALLALPEGATLINIQPPNRFTASGKDLADLAGLRYAYVTGDPQGEGFAVPLDRLAATLDLIEAIPHRP